jgi:hypothetical protein
MKDRSEQMIFLKLPALVVRNLICKADAAIRELENTYPTNPDTQKVWDTAIQYWKQVSVIMEEQLQEQLKY